MVKGEMLARTTILALKSIAQKHIETGKCRELALFHILAQRYDAWNFHVERRGMNLAIIGRHYVHPVKEHSLDCRLPWPQAERVVGQRSVVCIQHKRRACRQVACRIFISAAEMRSSFDHFGLEHALRLSPVD